MRILLGLLFLVSSGVWAQALPSWNDGEAKARIVTFVQAVSDKKSKEYVAPAERIAVFDNDGTLWAEQPMYFQFLFMLDQVKAAAPENPEWQDNDAFHALVTQEHNAPAHIT